MVRGVCLVAAMAAFVCAASPSSGVTVAVPENVAPWGFSADKPVGQQGIYAELGLALGKQAGVPVELRFLPYGRMLKDVQSGAVDYAFGVISPATSEAAPFAAVVSEQPMVAVARPGLTLERLEDLRGFKEVGFLRGGSCGKVVDGDAGINRVAQDNYESAIRKMAAGRLDGWCSIRAGFRYAAGALGMTEQVGPQFSYGKVDIGFQVTRGKVDAEETKRLVGALSELVRDGVAGEIFARYIGP